MTVRSLRPATPAGSPLAAKVALFQTAIDIDARVICDLMGHQTADMEKRYRHLFPEQRRAAVMSVFGNAQGMIL